MFTDTVCRHCDQPIYRYTGIAPVPVWLHEGAGARRCDIPGDTEASPKLANYQVKWSLDVEASDPEEAARQAYDTFVRPGSIAHRFTVVRREIYYSPSQAGVTEIVSTTAAEIDLDRGPDTSAPGDPLVYPASRAERDSLQRWSR